MSWKGFGLKAIAILRIPSYQIREPLLLVFAGSGGMRMEIGGYFDRCTVVPQMYWCQMARMQWRRIALRRYSAVA
jgi:hypothetical protein